MTQMIDGKAISAKIKEELKAEVGQKKRRGKRNLPGGGTGGK